MLINNWKPAPNQFSIKAGEWVTACLHLQRAVTPQGLLTQNLAFAHNRAAKTMKLVIAKNNCTMMPKSPVLTTCVILGLLLVLTSCSAIVRREAPSLSHVHIGHAVTAWEPAPNKQGLLVAAELYCIEAKANSDLMLEAAANGQLSEMKYHLSNIAALVDPTLVAQSSSEPYGLRKLMAEALVHLKVASEIFDASPNVRRTMAQVNVRGEKISSKIDELQVFLELALESESVSAMKSYTEEISNLLTMIGGQTDDTSIYGIQQFREDIDAMIAREDPPYQTIDKLYLFTIGI